MATFSEWSTVSVQSAVKCPDDVPLDVACLTSCGVGTGWGSAVHSAEVRPGDVVIVMGTGGIGMNAVQGAAHAGASVVIAVDPVEMKRSASFDFGATHAVATMEEATAIAQSFTNGQGADSAIVCVGVTTGEQVAQAVDSIRKAGTVVLTGLPRAADDGSLPVSLRHIVLFQKRLQGSLFGASSPSKDIPALLELYRQGRLKLTSSSPAATRSMASTRATTTCERGGTSAASSTTDSDPDAGPGSDHPGRSTLPGLVPMGLMALPPAGGGGDTGRGGRPRLAARRVATRRRGSCNR